MKTRKFRIIITLLIFFFILVAKTTVKAANPQVDAGNNHTVGLKSNGTVVAVGFSGGGKLDVGSWTDIVQVAAGAYHTVGLKSNGTVVAVGADNYGQLDVGSWTDIVQVDALFIHTVGLKSNGTVVAVGANLEGQLDVGSWTDIVQVDAGGGTLGLKSNGTVVAVGANYHGQLDVGSWTDIVQVAAGTYHNAGLKSNGTVVAVGFNSTGQPLNVGSWTDIVQVEAGNGHTVGLKSDGTVVAVGSNEFGQLDVGSWTDIVQVDAGWGYTVGLKSDGTVVAVGANDSGQCDIGGWNLFSDHSDVDQAIEQIFDCASISGWGQLSPCGAEIASTYMKAMMGINPLSLADAVCKAIVEGDWCSLYVEGLKEASSVVAFYGGGGPVGGAAVGAVESMVICAADFAGIDLNQAICDVTLDSLSWAARFALVLTHSPVDISVADISGNKLWIDLNGVVHNQLSDGSWILTLNEQHEIAIIPKAEDNYFFEITGRPEAQVGDTFGLSIFFPINETETLSVIYENVSVLPTTVATTSIGENVHEYSLQIDTNGDGIIDAVVLPTRINRESHDSDGGDGGGGCFIGKAASEFRR